MAKQTKTEAKKPEANKLAVKKKVAKKAAPKKAETTAKPKARGRAGYKPEEKKALLEKYQTHKQTMTAKEAAKKTGISYITLRTWEKKTEKPSKRKTPKKAPATPRKQGKAAGAVMASFEDGGASYTLIKTGSGFELQKIETVAKFGK